MSKLDAHLLLRQAKPLFAVHVKRMAKHLEGRVVDPRPLGQSLQLVERPVPGAARNPRVAIRVWEDPAAPAVLSRACFSSKSLFFPCFLAKAVERGQRNRLRNRFYAGLAKKVSSGPNPRPE